MQRANDNLMDKTVTWGQLIIAIAGLLITFATMSYNTGGLVGKYIERQAVTDMNVDQLKADVKEMKAEQERTKQLLMDKMDKNNETTNNILVILQNKQDRK
jgi:hypothetical protein